MATSPGLHSQLESGGRSAKPSSTSIHISTLDDIVSMNSLFTVALYLRTKPSTATKLCADGPAVSMDLVTFNTLSFSISLFLCNWRSCKSGFCYLQLDQHGVRILESALWSVTVSKEIRFMFVPAVAILEKDLYEVLAGCKESSAAERSAGVTLKMFPSLFKM
ncbi:hypothetical protein HAX54_020604 [Datura stramonium]|uniref:Uncharacterized protein n=1 Tax=Datura stramonium TaxID=4076 RepID=A0ABS8URD9_DATST|nr:hypothetical protein [Datura stramonium]